MATGSLLLISHERVLYRAEVPQTRARGPCSVSIGMASETFGGRGGVVVSVCRKMSIRWPWLCMRRFQYVVAPLDEAGWMLCGRSQVEARTVADVRRWAGPCGRSRHTVPIRRCDEPRTLPCSRPLSTVVAVVVPASIDGGRELLVPNSSACNKCKFLAGSEPSLAMRMLSRPWNDSQTFSRRINRRSRAILSTSKEPLKMFRQWHTSIDINVNLQAPTRVLKRFGG